MGLECGSKFIDHSEFGFKVIAHGPDCKQYCRIQFFKRVIFLPALELECGSKFIDHSEFGFKVIAPSPDCKQDSRIQFFKRVKKMFCQPWTSKLDVHL